MLRPDHIWFFFTVILSLALAMSIPPRKPKPQNQANLYTQVGEQSILRWNSFGHQWPRCRIAGVFYSRRQLLANARIAASRVAA